MSRASRESDVVSVKVDPAEGTDLDRALRRIRPAEATLRRELRERARFVGPAERRRIKRARAQRRRLR